MKKNVLLVSIAFPPKNDPEALQVAKYFKYLSKYDDLTFFVVTSSMPTLFMPADVQLKRFDQGYKQKIELPIYESKVTNFALRKVLPRWIVFPDSKFTFYWQWKKVVRKLTTKPDIIYSRSNPLSSAFLAYYLKKYFNVPWIMHLSDPWTDSPFHRYEGAALRFHKTWEQKCFSLADIISLTSEKAVAFYTRLYPHYQKKLRYFPNVLDSEDRSDNEISFDSKLRIVYTGGLTRDRSPELVLRAIRELESNDNQLFEKMEVVVAGPMDQYCTQLFKNTSSKVIRHCGMLSYDQSIALSKTAHILISIDMKIADSEKAMFFPSKLLDYFLAQRKIVAVTDSDSTTAKVLKNYNAEIILHDDAGHMRSFFVRSLHAFTDHDKNYFVANNMSDDFNADVQAMKLRDLIYSL